MLCISVTSKRKASYREGDKWRKEKEEGVFEMELKDTWDFERKGDMTF